MSVRRYDVTLEAPATPEDPDGIQRLKRWLKQSWRGYALRCVRVVPTPGQDVKRDATPRGEDSDARPPP